MKKVVVSMRKNRIQVSVDERVHKLLSMMGDKVQDNGINISQFCYAILREGLFYFLDDIDCDFSMIDYDIKHLLKRTESGIYDRQFQQAISKNNLKGGKNE